MKSLSIVFVLILAAACSEVDRENCGVPATVVDLTGLDGCGYVFELEDGTRLMPVWDIGFCGTPPLPKEVTEDPLYNFKYVEGRKVVISYEPRDYVTTCLAAKPVKITCLQDLAAQSDY